MPIETTFFLLSSALDFLTKRRPHGRAASDCSIPFRSELPLQTYLTHIYLHGACSPEDSEFLLSSYYISYVAYPPESKSVAPGFVDFSPYTGPFLVHDKSFFSFDEWSLPEKPMKDLTLETKLCESLSHGHPVVLHLNAFFLKGSSHYLKRNYRYFTLINSFEAASAKFGGIGHKNGAIVPVSLSARVLETAAYSPYGANWAFANNRIGAMRFHPTRSHELNLHDILRQYQCFLESCKLWPRLEEESVQGLVHGVKVYEILALYFEHCASSQTAPDLRYTRLLWEKQRASEVRLRALQLAGHIWAAVLIPRVKILDTRLRALHVQAYETKRISVKGKDWSFLKQYRSHFAEDIAVSEKIYQNLARVLSC